MSASVIIPYRDGCSSRARALAWLADRWRQRGFEPVIGTADHAGPWRKALAVHDGAARAEGDILVISDADVWSDRAFEAIEHVAAGAPWCVPHETVFRLSEATTADVLSGVEPAEARRRAGAYALVEHAHPGKVGGGLVVLARTVYEASPMDPRFAGWGGEDEAWGFALTTLFGPPKHLAGPLWHLWHPLQRRLSRTIGSVANDALRRRYYEARKDPEMMRQVVAEGQLNTPIPIG